MLRFVSMFTLVMFLLFVFVHRVNELVTAAAASFCLDTHHATCYGS